MIDEAELRAMSPAERRRLARSLAAMDYPHPLLGLGLDRGRRVGVLASVIACAVLAGWIIVLVLTLRREYTATHWRAAWVGFDVILLGAFAVTGWAFWRGRQIVIALLLITATLLCCDAWFDVILDLGTPEVWLSAGSALVAEMPLALLLFSVARRLIRLSALVAMGEEGGTGRPPSLWKIPLLGQRPGPGR